MKMELLSEKENVLMERKELEFRILQSGPTPKESDVKQEVAKLTGAQPDHIVIDKIIQSFGKLESLCKASVYKNAVKKKEKKGKAGEPAEGAAAKPEEKK